MAHTTEHISIRLPKWLVEELREQAKAEDRSLAWMIGYRCAQLSGDGARQTQQSAAVDHPQRIEPTLQVSNPAPPTKCTQTGHAGFYRSDGYWCATCRKMFV